MRFSKSKKQMSPNDFPAGHDVITENIVTT